MAQYKYIEETGVIVFDTADTRTEVEDEYKAAFEDSDLDTDASTPQGVLITGETSSRNDVGRNNAALANQINPNLAGGVFLDAIWKFTGGERSGPERTLVESVTVSGVPGSNIPALSKAQTPAGDIFESLSTVTLDGVGMGSVDFRSQEFGPIPCDSGQLSIIVSGVVGWETVNNTQDGIQGEDKQSDVSARRERQETIGLQGRSLTEAVFSNVRAVDGVTSLQFLENETSSPVVKENVNLAPHSIWVCVDGGSDQDVAESLNEAKTGGTGYNGSVSVVVTDPYSNQDNTVIFDRPTDVPVLIRTTVSLTGAITNPEATIRQAILDYTQGLIDNFEGFIVGNNVSPNQISQAIGTVLDGVFINSMEVSLAAPISYQPTEIDLEIFEQASIQLSDISVTIS